MYDVAEIVLVVSPLLRIRGWISSQFQSLFSRVSLVFHSYKRNTNISNGHLFVAGCRICAAIVPSLSIIGWKVSGIAPQNGQGIGFIIPPG